MIDSFGTTKRGVGSRLRRVALAVAGAATLAVAAGAIVVYEPNPPESAPSVLVSVDRSLWNRLGLNRFTYVATLRRAGLRTVLRAYPDDVEAAGSASLPVGIAGLVLTGGGDVAAERYGGDPETSLDVEPARDAFELALLAQAQREELPVLGLCRGAQLLNVYRGGTLGQFRDDTDRYARHRNAFVGHAVEFEPDSFVAEIYDRSTIPEITTWHGQYVAIPGDGLRIVGRAPDGTPEAIETTDPRDRFVVGVQWHAEVPPWDDLQSRLFEAYARAVTDARQASTKAANNRR
ncbi:MAG: gamma-glutamyl-gamma-aminobutyrate hydrolase family protein [Woeseiaceae bacterium]|nr:gamma-glutamyl-gamma-aminobutyrate hydrolase family protein [Woeseiaceae bacterium]